MIADYLWLGSTYHYPRCVRASGPGGPRCRRASFWVCVLSCVRYTHRSGPPQGGSQPYLKERRAVSHGSPWSSGSCPTTTVGYKSRPVFGDFPAVLTLVVYRENRSGARGLHAWVLTPWVRLLGPTPCSASKRTPVISLVTHAPTNSPSGEDLGDRSGPECF